MNRLSTTAVIAGGLLVLVYVASPQYAPGPPSVATVSIRFDDRCYAYVRDAGYAVSRYERVSVPVERVLDSGVLSLTFPAASEVLGPDCAHIVDFSTLVFSTCAANPGVCELWDAGFPFVRAARLCLRENDSKSLPCPLLDGGTFGDLNVSPRSTRLDPAQCEPVECVVWAGEDPGTVL